ncbi:family 20 glycosylhydrolase [Rhodocytophaga rosea]|uniref:beta-N-acetylhexosaminidase n=1 Tax=Rhodocytophaga rosea TaxID=2704465 RepID=A0A6C0GHJ1_9BACT|nr:family 20 glycosylhydrolase [Rhodocytophaga rosea]QHT67541.1 family 20 glycosylhydrolase [Rhodocytophaga rosea]
MKSSIFSLLVVLAFLLLYSCKPGNSENNTTSEASTYDKLAVRWEQVSNLAGEDNVFEAKFTLTNNSNITLTGNKWALFFSMSPRPIQPNKTPQPATVQHINGDWYKMIPEANFSLESGKSVDVTYWGKEGMIKEIDGPLGLYVVWYDEKGAEEKITQIADYQVTPFTRPEQMNRNKEDVEPIPTAALRYKNNQAMSQIPADQLQKIVPSPVSLKLGKGELEVSGSMSVEAGKELENEATYLGKSMDELTAMSFSTEKGSGKPIRLQLGQVKVNGISKEAYRLSISAEGITITGSDPAGVFYGIQSLKALVPYSVYNRPSGTVVSFSLPYLTIEDAPRFEFRGLHLDVGRNFQTKETILRTLDILSFYKINRFLFYTTEDEGWRVEIKGLPELTEVGAQRQHTTGKETPVLHPSYGSGPVAKEKGKHGSGYYTRQDFIDILKYANERHIKVIPEVNFPGHARAAIKAMEARYERLMKEGKKEEAEEYRLIDPDDKSEYLSAQGYKDNVVSVARESTYRFYEKVVDEIAAMYQEAGLTMDVFHTGGDEVPEGSWTKSPMASELMAKQPEIKDPKNLQAYFFGRLLPRLEKRNLQIHGWEEVALLKNAEGKYIPNPAFAGKNVVPYIWNNIFDYDLGYRLANAGYKVVLCNVTNFYFDMSYNKDPQEPGLYWAGFVDTRNTWTFAPYDMFKTTLKTSLGREIKASEFEGKERLKPEARKNILGVEAQMWSETIKGREMLEYYMLPKLMGFAESAWSPQRVWETIDNKEQREVALNKGWNIFANTLAQQELPRLSRLNGGYNYRIPLPGAIIANGMLQANTEFPGLIIRYTTDGKEPDKNSPQYTAPVQVSGPVMLKCFDAAGKSSRTAIVKPGEGEAL